MVPAASRWTGVAARFIRLALLAGHPRAGRRISLCLSGGSTPVPVYRTLAGRDELRWAEMDVFFADERFVPADHPDSNFRMVREALLNPLGARAPSAYFAGRTEGADLEEAVARYIEVLEHPLDVLVLGIGSDGHTASLFPNDARLTAYPTEADPRSDSGQSSGSRESRQPHGGGGALVLPVHDAPKPPRHRITISPAVISSARHVFVLARGESKADAVHRALRGAWDPVRCPAQWARGGTWILDPLAASGVI